MPPISTHANQAADAVGPRQATPGEAASEPQPAADGGARTRPVPLFTRADLLIYAAYLVAAVGVVGRLWFHVGSRTMNAYPPDHQQAMWFLAHAARAVTGGHNPLYTHQLNVPDGVNLMANTSMLGLGIPVTPVTVLFGPPVSFALLLTLALAGTAAGWYVVFRRTVINGRLAAAVGAGFCGFAPGLVSHAGGQLNWVAQFAIPFVVLAVMRLAEPGHGLRRSLTLGLLVTYQVFINEELLLLTAVACGIFVAMYAWLRWSQVRPVAAVFVRRLAGAGAIAGVLLAYPLWFQFFGPRHYRGLPFDPTNYPADVWSYVAFAGESLAGSAAGAARFGESPTEQNAFFGWPLMLLCLVIGWWLWRRALVKAALVTAAVFAVLSFGRTIVVAGRDTGIPGPFRLVAELPLGELLVPTRFALVVVPVIGLLLALGADRTLTLPWRDPAGIPVRGVWAVAFAAALVPIVPTPVQVRELPPAPSFITGGVWREYVAPGGSVVPVPVPSNKAMTGQTWAAGTLTEMPVPAGYFLGPTTETDPQGHWGPPPRPTARLLDGIAVSGRVPTLTGADRRNLLEDLRFWRASVVVLGEHAHGEQLRAALEELLGPATRRADVWLWDVRALVDAE